MTIIQMLILAAIQGIAELLPISSSGHVIVAEKLLGLDPTKPEMVLLLVLLHTGTMFSVIVFYWKSWKDSFFSSWNQFINFLKLIILATALTGTVGLLLKFIIEKIISKKIPNAEIEMIFGNTTLIALSLAIVGILIICAGHKKQSPIKNKSISVVNACLIGIVQGICLPFRGLSRSGATISTGLILNINKKRAEEFSFALAVALTPIVIIHEVLRLLRAQTSIMTAKNIILKLCIPNLIGMSLSFLVGLMALKWLSIWLAKGRWYLFGIYCLCASMSILILSRYIA